MNNLPEKPRKNFIQSIFNFFRRKKQIENKADRQATEELKRNFMRINAPINTEEEFYDYLEKVKSGQYKVSSILSRIPPNSELQNTKTIVLDALSVFGLDLQYVSDNLKNDPQVVEQAIESNPLAIQYIENKTPKIIKKSVSLNYLALEYIDESFCSDPLNRDFFWGIVKTKGACLGYLQAYHNDVEFVTEATNNTPEAIKYAGEKIPNSLIVNAITKRHEKISNRLLGVVEQCKDAFDFYGYHHNMYISFINDIENIKNTSPARFENLDFMLELVDISPELSVLAPEEMHENEQFVQKLGNYDKDDELFGPYYKYKDLLAEAKKERQKSEPSGLDER